MEEMLIYYTAVWFILRLLGIVCGHLAYFMVIWYIFSHFGMLPQEKSGNPALTVNGRSELTTLGIIHCWISAKTKLVPISTSKALRAKKLQQNGVQVTRGQCCDHFFGDKFSAILIVFAKNNVKFIENQCYE
jgi:hypothetical protein